MANFIASYTLSILTLIGLVVAIVFYFQQNRIILEKNRVENFYRLKDYLTEIKFEVILIKFNKDHVSEIKNPNYTTFSNRNSNGFRSILNSLDYALHQYNNDTLDRKMFDFFNRNNIFWFWIIIKQYAPEIKNISKLDMNISELENYVNKIPKTYYQELLKYIEDFDKV